VDILSILRALSPEAQFVLLSCVPIGIVGLILILLAAELFPTAARNITHILLSLDRFLSRRDSWETSKQKYLHRKSSSRNDNPPSSLEK
jgi:hypothetical protein